MPHELAFLSHNEKRYCTSLTRPGSTSARNDAWSIHSVGGGPIAACASGRCGPENSAEFQDRLSNLNRCVVVQIRRIILLDAFELHSNSASTKGEVRAKRQHAAQAYSNLRRHQPNGGLERACAPKDFDSRLNSFYFDQPSAACTTRHCLMVRGRKSKHIKGIDWSIKCTATRPKEMADGCEIAMCLPSPSSLANLH